MTDFFQTHEEGFVSREAADSCQFDAGLDELAVKHGGKQPSLKWIEQMLKKQKADGDTADIEQKVNLTSESAYHNGSAGDGLRTGSVGG